MGKSVYVSAGHNRWDPGACSGKSGKYIREADEVRSLADEVARVLEEGGVTAYRDRWDMSWQETVAEANEKKVDLFIELHENAGGGDGAEVILHNSGNQHIADAFRRQFLAMGQQWRRTIVDPDFWVLRYTHMPAAIVEVAFVDSRDILDFDSRSEKVRAAGYLARAVAEILGRELQPEIRVGDRVRIRPGARWYQGGSIPLWVVRREWVVSSLSGGRAVLDRGGINSPVWVGDLYRAEDYCDGVFGTVTARWVQAKLGVPVTGRIQGQSQRNLGRAVLPGAVNLAAWEFLEPEKAAGDKTIRAWQRALGMAEEDCDGQLGMVTVKKIEERFGIRRDGQMGPVVVRAIQAWAER